jgi:hypothetical protein
MVGTGGRRTVRWALVAATAVIACAVPSVVASLPAAGSSISVDQLRQRIQASGNQEYSGYARTQAELGLPSLPDLGDLTSLLSGTTNVRVWYQTHDVNRVDVIDNIGERDVYRTPLGTYTWDYASNLLTEVLGTAPLRLPTAGDLLPAALAQRVLTMDPGDPVTALPPRRIAGISAAGLRIRPSDPATTVAQVDIWADPDNGVPLRVEITARGATKPILTSWFLNIDLGAPDPSALRPPAQPGGVSQAAAPTVLSALNQLGRLPLPAWLGGYRVQPQLPGLPGVGRYGSGLSQFEVLPLSRNVASSAFDTATKDGGKKVTVPFGRAVVIQIPLLTVLIEQVGYRRSYLVAGLVNPTVLEQAANELANLRFRRVR